MHKRTKATSIPKKVKEKVWERDGRLCVICGRPGNPWCHFIPRSQGGLGIEENVVTLCNECHAAMDNSTQSKALRMMAEEYLKSKYPSWNKEKLVYTKW
jgi:5-methylcytosine-specific restriction endonuclease McrA